MDFKNFDKRKYPTVSPKEGYGEWAETYEDIVPDQLDIRVLRQLNTVNWASAKECLDLACGTGRIGKWLTERGVSTIDGIDLTPEMLDKARNKKLYRHLFLGPVEETGITHSGYDLLIMSLVDEHLPTLDRAGWVLQEMFEGVIDEEWLRVKPKWKSYENYPVNFGYVWTRS